MRAYAKERARDRIAWLAGQGLDLAAFWTASSKAIAAAVPHYQGPCWFTLDPASLLITSHFQVQVPEIPHAWLAQQYLEDDYLKLADVARSDCGVGTLHEATGGDPTRSGRYRGYIQPYGAEQEMVTGLRTRSGEIWGAVSVYRETGQPLFDAEDQRFMVAIAPILADGARRALLLSELSNEARVEAPGLIVLRDDWTVESMSPELGRWLAELPDGNPESGDLPASVYSVAGKAMLPTSALVPGDVTVARVRSRIGRWIVLHAMPLLSDSRRRVGIIVEAAHPARISSLLMTAYRLTKREQEITQLVLKGRSTVQIARDLGISAHTVQQHLKSVFEKTSVRSRRELVAKLFFAHYEPRVRDNESRVARKRPMLGGPAVSRRSTTSIRSGG